MSSVKYSYVNFHTSYCCVKESLINIITKKKTYIDRKPVNDTLASSIPKIYSLSLSNNHNTLHASLKVAYVTPSTV